MAVLAGEWSVPTIDGPRRLVVDDIEYGLPERGKCDIKLVSASGGYSLAHVRIGTRAYVFSRFGQFVEDDAAARSRAASWSRIQGSRPQ